MKRYIGILFSLVVLTISVRAAETNQIVMPPATRPLWVGGFDSALLERAAWVPATVTNQPLWNGSISMGLTLTRGNSDTLMANTTFGLHRNNLTNEWVFDVDGTYGEAGGVENAETIHGFGQYNHLFTGRMFGFTRAEAWHDGVEDVVYRVTLNPGLGYYFIKNQQTLLSGGVGPGVVDERLDNEEIKYMTLRVAERFEHKFGGHARLWNYAEFLPQVDKPENFLVNAEIGIESPITKQLSLRTVIQDSFANIPAPGHKDNDLKLISGLVYKF